MLILFYNPPTDRVIRAENRIGFIPELCPKDSFGDIGKAHGGEIKVEVKE
jgi:hypothetical protein